MTIDYIQSVINAIRERIECGQTNVSRGPATLPLVQYLLPGEQVPDMVRYDRGVDNHSPTRQMRVDIRIGE
jgi:hypothetical protein